MRYLLLTALYVALVAYCITDVLNHRDQEPHGLHRIAWIIIILLFPYIGAAAWLLMKFRSGGGKIGRRPQVAPDDDPEYLNWLREQQRRKRNSGDGPS